MYVLVPVCSCHIDISNTTPYLTVLLTTVHSAHQSCTCLTTTNPHILMQQKDLTKKIKHITIIHKQPPMLHIGIYIGGRAILKSSEKSAKRKKKNFKR